MTSHSGSAYITIFDRGWKKLTEHNLMSHNDLDLQMGNLKLFVCLPVMLKYQAKYVLLNHNQKYRTTIAYLGKGSESAFL